MPITVRFKMQEGAEDLAPKKAHEDDAAWDLKSRVDVEAAPGKVTLIPTGLFLELPAGYEAQIRPRRRYPGPSARGRQWSGGHSCGER